MTFKVTYTVSKHEDKDTKIQEVDQDTWEGIGQWCDELTHSGFSVWYDVVSVERIK